MNDKIDDEESLALTLRAPPKISNHIFWYRRNLKFILMFFIILLICEIVFIIHNVKYKTTPIKNSITYNIPLIQTLPINSVIIPEVKREIKPEPTVNQIKQFIKPKIIIKDKNNSKDYGI